MGEGFGSRRRALKLLGVAIGATALGAAPGCQEEAADQLRIPVSKLPAGGRLEVSLAGVPIEVRRTQAGLEARSLLCTHMGCRVLWREEEGHYHCACHDARFDRGGEVLEGPPPRPLTRVPARLEGGQIVIG